MIREENLTKDYVKSIMNRFSGTIFGLAPYLGIWFDNEDIRYIETKMMTDKKYRAVSGKVGGPKTNSFQIHKYRDIWLLGFLDDPEITTGVKAFIIYYTGHHRGDLKVGDEYHGTHRYNDFMHERFLAARWRKLVCKQVTRKNIKKQSLVKNTGSKKLIIKSIYHLRIIQ